MHIIELRADNFARLVAVEIRPDGHMVKLAGRNRQGKTSVLRAIWATLEGRASAPARAIRDGEHEARLQVDLGHERTELSIMRTVRRGPDGDEIWSLKVTGADGQRVARSPQAMIDASLAALGFDPLAFARAEPRSQLAILKQMIPGIDFAALARQRQELFDQRTDQNRAARSSRARASGVVLPPGPEPEAIDVTTLFALLKEATDQANERQRLVQRAADDARKCVDLRREATELERRARELRMEADDIEERASLILMPDDRTIEIEALQQSIASAQDVDRARAAHAERRGHEQAAAEAEAEAARLTRAIDDLDARVEAAVSAANLPAGLSLTEDGVLMNGVPFADASMAEKILASAEVCMATRPALRVMLIDEASELDAESLKALTALAEQRDYQVWLSRVQDGATTGFIIEDGRVSYAPAKKAARS